MTATDYEKSTTDELLDKFVETAKRAGSVYTFDPVVVSNPQLKALAPELQALGAELRKRNPREEIRELFQHENPHVRGWAGPQFRLVDPEWGTATMTGLFEGLTTREVLDWRERVLRGPPPQPTLQEMTVPQLLERFVDACERCYGTTRYLMEEQGGGLTMTAYNKASGEIFRTVKELDSRGERRSLLPFLEHPVITVQEKAAMYCLDVATEKAVAALEAVDATGTSKEGVEASMVLSLWRRGVFKPLLDRSDIS